MEVVRWITDYLRSKTPSATQDGVFGERIVGDLPEWKSGEYSSGMIESHSESLHERLAGWVGLSLPKRVSVIQDLDPSTVFALEVCKVIPPELVGLLAILGIVFLISLGLWGLKFVWKLVLRVTRARSRRATPVPSAPNSARPIPPVVSAEVAAVLAAIAANNSALVTRSDDRVVQHRRRRI